MISLLTTVGRGSNMRIWPCTDVDRKMLWSTQYTVACLLLCWQTRGSMTLYAIS